MVKPMVVLSLLPAGPAGPHSVKIELHTCMRKDLHEFADGALALTLGGSAKRRREAAHKTHSKTHRGTALARLTEERHLQDSQRKRHLQDSQRNGICKTHSM